MVHLLLAGVLVAMQTAAPPAAATATVVHDKAFWQAIVKQDYAPPAIGAIEPLVQELSSYLASPDPELRDELAYSILTSWIYEKHLVPAGTVRGLMTEWAKNLSQDIGSTGTDAVFRRSFSALMLSTIVATDNAKPFLESTDVRSLLNVAIAYLNDERDVRGYDPRKGWMHSAAHTADLLKFLGRSRFVTVSDQPLLLGAIVRKLRDTPEVFTHGEDERFARAILSLVNRQDFDAAGFTDWVTRSMPTRPTQALPDPAWLSGRQNVTNLFAKLEVLLTLQDPAPASASAPAAAGTPAARDALRAALKKLY
jgi:hypothetical protein